MWENTRLFALLNMALADGNIGTAETQYFRQNLSCLFDDDAIVTKGFVIRAGFF